jgi:IS4 transposase
MPAGEVFERFLQEAPICVMVRATLEGMFAPEAVDRLFREHSQQQYERELLFSGVVELMSLVVCRIERSVHAAYQRRKEALPVSVQSLYNKLNGLEPEVSQALVRHTAQTAATLIDRLGPRRSLLQGHRLLVVDGNHLTGTDHRLEVLRDEGGAALPGVAVAVLDPQRRMIADVVSAEDAYVQETQLLEPILGRLQPKDVVIADRQFSTSNFLFDIAAKRAFFIVRQHQGHLRCILCGRRRYRGRTETGRVYEQDAELIHPQTGEVLRVRRVTVQLDQPTREGETELHLLTNLSPRVAPVEVVAELYRHRWTVETAFQEITTQLRCELTSLGYPAAALLTFCVAAACYNAFAVIHAALRGAYGGQTVEEEVSAYYLTEELGGTYRGMMIALPPAAWSDFQLLSPAQLAGYLKRWAARVNLARYQKHPRGPKTRTQRAYSPTKHVSTARLLKKHKPPPRKIKHTP